MLSRRRFIAASSVLAGSGAAVGAVVASTRASATAPTLDVALHNATTSDAVYAFVTGQAIDNGKALFLLRADGRTAYFPSSPPGVGAPVAVDCAIRLGAPGSTTEITVPRIAGGRVWFSVGAPLTFLINPGPALAEPSVTNPSDPNIDAAWDFCELTFDANQLYANISYVDFVGLPLALTLQSATGRQQVAGLASGGLDTICSGLLAQHNADSAGWNRLVVTSGGRNLRALSPDNGIAKNPSLFSGYFDPYIEQVWSKYTDTPLSVDTQASFGTLTGRVSSGLLTFNGAGSFARPTAADIFSCSTGPFATTSGAMGPLTARLSAAFNRSTLLIDSDQPAGEHPADYYKNPITNHYARIVHAANLDGRGYSFPYDDVTPTNGADQSGAVNDPNPTLLTITVGGTAASGPAVAAPAAPAVIAGAGAGASGSAAPSPATGTAKGAGSAYSMIQAESHTASNGTRTEPCSDTGGGLDVGAIHNGCWLEYPNLDFGSTGATQLTARVASGAAAGVGGLVQVALDSPGAKPVGSFAVAGTGGWQRWVTVPANIAPVTGVHTVYLVFSSAQDADFVNLNWFTFS